MKLVGENILLINTNEFMTQSPQRAKNKLEKEREKKQT